ncbi:Repressor ROX1 [Psilocybe cubensis]|uniref:HMG box domain-containing protein n=2 Tax=Psilocybe cubensis TaxID=181762 RepID=A0A8H8CQJ9_PSICU|nr:Repressor ROX1 [Psilocybe cubensis]KAH9486699.1 Repressor ROX1 [Psilocybe cubensis]
MDYTLRRKDSADDNLSLPFVAFEHNVVHNGASFTNQRAPKDEDFDFFKATPSSLVNALSKDTARPTFEPLSPALTVGDNSGDEHASTPGRIARPRNAFMLYRSDFLASDRISRSVEHDNRHISRIIGHCWQNLSKEEKLVWHQRAELEKIEHAKKHPGYKFSPVPRTKKPLKRKGKRNSEKDIERCKNVAELILAGKEGDELVAALKQLELENGEEHNQDGSETPGLSYASYPPEESRAPVFLNPLRPPNARDERVQSTNVSVPQPYCSFANDQGHRHQYYPSPPESPVSPNPMYSDNRSRNPFLLRPATFYPQHSHTTSNIQSRIEPYPHSPGVSRGQMNHAQSSSYQFLQGSGDRLMRIPQQNADFFINGAEHSYTFLSPSLPPSLAPSRYASGHDFYGDSGL